MAINLSYREHELLRSFRNSDERGRSEIERFALDVCELSKLYTDRNDVKLATSSGKVINLNPHRFP